MPSRKPNTDLRLGLWKIRILHLASLEPVWGAKLVKRVASWGETVPSSVVHDALAFMAKKGWLVQVSEPAASIVRAFSISPAGRQRLDQLRKQIGDLHDDLQGTGVPGVRASVAEQLKTMVRRTLEERDKMRNALAAVRDVVSLALGTGGPAWHARHTAGKRPARTRPTIERACPSPEVRIHAWSGEPSPRKVADDTAPW